MNQREAVMSFPKLGFEVTNPMKTVLALILASVMLVTGCWTTAQWLQIAINDLPVLIQMALSIAQIVGTVTGNPPNPPSDAEVAAINKIGNIANQGLTEIQALYDSYTSANATTVIPKIKAAGAALVANLQQLLTAAQIKNPALRARVTAAVDLIVSTLNTVIALLPQTVTNASMKAANKAAKAAKIPTSTELRQAWLDKVGFALAKPK